MSNHHESLFDAIFGDGGMFESIFGGKDGGFTSFSGEQTSASIRDAAVKRSRARRERDCYHESLVTELLTTLAGKKLLTNEEARDVISRAKERAKKKAGEDEKSEAQRASGHKHDTSGGACPLRDTRPHKSLECQRCRKATPHLIEGEVARCRACLTPRMSS